jgi:dTDP-4-dehydrorhamnose reductase
VGECGEPAPPVLHYTNWGTTSWFGFARAVFEGIGADPARVVPITSAELLRPAPRPAYSVLDDSAWRAAGLPAPRPWRVAFGEALPLLRA